MKMAVYNNKVTIEIAKQQARLGGIFITMYQKENDAALLAEFQDVLKAQMMRTVIPYGQDLTQQDLADFLLEQGYEITQFEKEYQISKN